MLCPLVLNMAGETRKAIASKFKISSVHVIFKHKIFSEKILGVCFVFFQCQKKKIKRWSPYKCVFLQRKHTYVNIEEDRALNVYYFPSIYKNIFFDS